jgi:hypothetical protein
MKSTFLVIFIILSSNAFAQISLGISGGVDPNGLSLYNQTAADGDNAYWKKGVTVGINGDYIFSERFQISASFQYSQYKFDKYPGGGFVIPEIRFISAEGENAKFWRTSIEAKYFPFPQYRFKFFILSGLGIIVEDLGTIKVHYSSMMQNSQSTYILDTKIKNSLVHSLGLGVRTNILSNLFMDISVLYYTDYVEIFQAFIGLSFGYSIYLF